MIKENLAVLILCFLVVLLSPVFVNALNNISITGKATSQQTNVSITIIGAPASLTLITPRNVTYPMNSTIILNFTTSGHQSIWYALNGTSNISISSYVQLNLSEGQYRLILYVNNTDNTITSRNVTFAVNSTILNISFEEYRNKGATINFMTFGLEEIRSMNIILENTPFGKIVFSSPIDLLADYNQSDSTVDIDNAVNISYNEITLNSSLLPNFNISAVLTLSNLTFTNPRILRDGSPCPESICTKNSYEDGVLEFIVQGFSTYSADETPSGGGTASTAVDSSTGGGGIASIFSKPNITQKIELSPNKLSLSIRQGETKREITLTNKGSKPDTLTFDISNLKQFMKIQEDIVHLASGESRNITLDFIAPENTIPDTYLGSLIVISDFEENELLIALSVQEKNPLFDVTIEIPEEFQTIAPGKTLLSEVKLYNLGALGRVDAVLTYEIIDRDGHILFASEETLAIETQASFTKRTLIPENTPEGSYILKVKVSYAESAATSSAWFAVKIPSNEQKYAKYLLFLVIIGIIIAFFFIPIIRRSADKL